MSRKRGRSTRQGRSGSRRPWSSPPSPYGAPGADEDIADSGDNPDDVRLTVTAKLVVRVTRPEILRKYTADAQRSMAEAHSPGDFGELAYLAVTSEGLDEIAEGPAGQLRSDDPAARSQEPGSYQGNREQNQARPETPLAVLDRCR